MEVPKFPSPPPRNAGIPSRRDPSARAVSFSFAPREDHDAALERKRPGSNGCRKVHRRSTVHPRLARERGKCIRKRVTELRLRMTEPAKEQPTLSPPLNQRVEKPPGNDATANTPTTISECASSPIDEIDRNRRTSLDDHRISTGVQTIHGVPYRLRFLPIIRDIVEEDENAKKSSRFSKYLRFLGRLSLSQFGLLWLLMLWAVVGAAAFYTTEGPRERSQDLELKDQQKELAINLAMELRQLKAKDEEIEPVWSRKVQLYLVKHEKVLLKAVNAGYGEGGESGQLWTFPGCILFAISLLTTLGFGAPVPRTNAGRTVTVVFAAIGIPAHFLLIMNFGLLMAVRLQRYAVSRKYKRQDIDLLNSMLPVPKWVKVVPFCCIILYYILGILAFGVARLRPFAASVLFPLDFTAAGGLATTSDHVRILYGIYLEIAVTLASIALAVLRVSATQSLTNIGLKYGLLTHA